MNLQELSEALKPQAKPDHRKLPIWYRKWSNMIRRCYSPQTHNYKDYGGRGITVCDRWRQWKYGARNFLQDMGEPAPGMTLGRKDNTLGYSPENCQWETWKEQAQNRRPGGPKPDPKSLSQQAKKAGMPYMLVYQRIKSGWSKEDALTIPKQPRGRIKGLTKDKFGLKLGAKLLSTSPLNKATSPLPNTTSPHNSILSSTVNLIDPLNNPPELSINPSHSDIPLITAISAPESTLPQ